MSTPDAKVDPNLSLYGDPRGKVRYPSPFFDVSQQYIPPTIKELFKWVYFYCTNNSFLGPALQKIARYPVTDLVLEDPNQDVVRYWTTLMNNTMSIKTFNMEVNLDLTSYGNAFVSVHYPFARHLECGGCKQRTPWKAAMKKIENLNIKMKCKCGHDGAAKIVDVPYKSVENLRVLRFNPEYIDIKYNESSGRHTYLYSIPDKLKRSIMAGDPDILEDTPAIYLDAIKQRRKIKLSGDNIFHLKNPTLAGKDMGWGLPRIAVALKDLYHYYTLRRAQEAVMNEHIIPFDILFPQANGKMDPYTHTDLSSWKREMQNELAKRRRDPNYKAIVPFPIGYQRVGGDGKALMLTPEMDFLAKTIIGACGIPQEFVYGGTMNWSGSSVSLRTLENDFLHQRTQLLHMNIWLVERFRLYLGLAAPKGARFSDFKMADDMQKLQMMVGMASNKKLPWEDIQRELGRDPEVVRKKIEEESAFDAKLNAMEMTRSAEAQAQAQQVMAKFQVKQQSNTGAGDVEIPVVDKTTGEIISELALRVASLKPELQEAAIAKFKDVDSKFGGLLEKALQNVAQGQEPVPSARAYEEAQQAAEQQVQQGQGKVIPMKQDQKAPQGADMRPLPQQRPPRRQGGI